MSFLQPSILWALPVIALPIIIHLINQRRFQTVHFGAMQFLLAADQMSKGYARLRQWLILAARALAIAALIFAISRPLATAWHTSWLANAAGGDQNTSIILLDRSPSMDQRGQGGVSKRLAGLRQLSESLNTLNPSNVVLIASGDLQAREIESLESLEQLPLAAGEARSANLPAMLDVAYQYITANRPSRCDVWIVSDLQQADWQPGGGQWSTLRSMFRSLPQSIQFHLLAFTDQAKPNFAVRLEDVVKVKQPEQAAIRLTFQIDASAASAGNVVAGAGTIPIQIELDGAASEINVPLSGDRIEGIDQLIPIDANQSRGWGRVALPADRNPGDNEFFFVYDDPQVRQTLVVSEDPQATEPLAIAASINANPAFSCRSETIRPETMVATPLDDVSLILWQASLPKADEAVVQNLISWAKRGGTIIFFPPQQPGDGVIAECSWQTWQDGVGVSSWVDDQDLLADTKAGESLPLGDLRIDRYCKLSGPQRILATLGDGSALLTRPSDFSSIENSTTGWPQEAKLYFFTTTASDSSLAKDGVVLFAIIHRALQRTSGLRDRTRIYSTSELRGADPTGWQRVAGATGMLSSGYHRHAGVFRDGDRLIAINRAEAEDRDRTLSDRQVASLFAGLPFDRVDTSTETASSLVREIWRLFLLLMLAALLIESVLSVPRDRHLFHAGERAAASTSTMRSF